MKILMFKISSRFVKVSKTCKKHRIKIVNNSGEASPTFGHANANFSVFIDRTYKESTPKEMNNNNDLNLHSMAGFATGKQTLLRALKHALIATSDILQFIYYQTSYDYWQDTNKIYSFGMSSRLARMHA